WRLAFCWTPSWFGPSWCLPSWFYYTAGGFAGPGRRPPEHNQPQATSLGDVSISRSISSEQRFARRLIADLHLRRANERLVAVQRLHRADHHPGSQQGPFDGIGRAVLQ